MGTMTPPMLRADPTGSSQTPSELVLLPWLCGDGGTAVRRAGGTLQGPENNSQLLGKVLFLSFLSPARVCRGQSLSLA